VFASGDVFADHEPIPALDPSYGRTKIETWTQNSAVVSDKTSTLANDRQRVNRTPGWLPSINSTPAASSTRRIAAKLLIEGTRRPFSKSRTVLSLKFDRAANSA